MKEKLLQRRINWISSLPELSTLTIITPKFNLRMEYVNLFFYGQLILMHYTRTFYAIKWVSSGENLIMLHANNKGADQTAFLVFVGLFVLIFYVPVNIFSVMSCLPGSNQH